MNLREAVLDAMTMPDLREVFGEFGFGNVDLRYRDGMVDTLYSTRRVTAELLLGKLSEEQVKRVCQLVGSPQIGRKRELVEELLDGDGKTAQRGKPRPPRRVRQAIRRRSRWQEQRPIRLPGLRGERAEPQPMEVANRYIYDHTRSGWSRIINS